MSLHHHKLKVLAILSDNLRMPQPQLVPTVTIARQMDIPLPKLNQILKTMNGLGIIQIDSDLQYNLITIKGLDYLSERQLIIPKNFQFMRVTNKPACAKEIDAPCLAF